MNYIAFNHTSVNAIYTTLIESRHKLLIRQMLRSASRYAQLRVDWHLSDTDGRREIDEERTLAHNAFISNCDIVSRNMKLANEDTKWRQQIGDDRKLIGDFACWLHLIMGVLAR